MFRKKLFNLIGIIGLLFCCYSNLIASKIIFKDLSVSYNPAPFASYFEDSTHVFSIEEVLALDSLKFQNTEEENINFIRSKSKFWVVFEIENQTEEPLTLLVKNPWINYLNVYIIDESGCLRKIESGNFIPFENRSFKTSEFSFDLSQKPSKIILETSTSTEFHLRLSVEGRKTLIATLHSLDLFNGFIFGILVALFFYNFLLYLSIRDQSYIWYILYIAGRILIYLRTKGVGFELFWSDAPFWNGGSAVPSAVVLCVWVLFVNSILDLKYHSKYISHFLKGSVLVTVVITITAVYFSNFKFLVGCLQLGSVVYSYGCILIAFYVWYKGNKIAPYFIMAWSSYLILRSVTIAAYSGFLPLNFITLNFSTFNALIMHILMSLVLAFRYNSFKKDALSQAEENQRILEDQNTILEKKVTERTAELEQLNHTKDRIFAIIGHDLRKPVVAFSGISETINYLVKKEDYSTLQQLGDEIEKDGFALQKLTDNLLNWALMQRDVMPYHPSKINLSEKAEEVALIFRNVARDKNIELINAISEGQTVFADPNALLTILVNLTDNAIKYTPEGGRVEITAEESSDGIQIQVSDTGIGMSKEQLQEVFLLQKDKSQKGTGGEKGTGLGLHLVNELVKLNGGEIAAESAVGEGTTFRVLLPKKALAAA